MARKLVIASNNKGKIAEFHDLLAFVGDPSAIGRHVMQAPHGSC